MMDPAAIMDWILMHDEFLAGCLVALVSVMVIASISKAFRK